MGERRERVREAGGCPPPDGLVPLTDRFAWRSTAFETGYSATQVVDFQALHKIVQTIAIRATCPSCQYRDQYAHAREGGGPLPGRVKRLRLAPGS